MRHKSKGIVALVLMTFSTLAIGKVIEPHNEYVEIGYSHNKYSFNDITATEIHGSAKVSNSYGLYFSPMISVIKLNDVDDQNTFTFGLSVGAEKQLKPSIAVLGEFGLTKSSAPLGSIIQEATYYDMRIGSKYYFDRAFYTGAYMNMQILDSSIQQSYSMEAIYRVTSTWAFGIRGTFYSGFGYSARAITRWSF